MRFIAEARIRTRCIRRRSRSRSARSSSDGIHSSGTRSRRASSASTRASTLSVLHASGATSRTLRACAICTRQPAAASWSRTQIAPLIISTTARTSRAALDHQPGQPVSVGRHRPLADDRAGLAERTPRRPAIRPIDPEILHDRASPSRVETADHAQSAGRPTFGAPSFMTFHVSESLGASGGGVRCGREGSRSAAG